MNNGYGPSGHALLVAIALTAVAPAYAVDGVVLIDQAKVAAGNVTPGDTPGFPVTLSREGSYRLAGNLSVPAGVSGIVITASNVTLDLNGFTIAGAGTKGGVGIDASGTSAINAAIVNGTVRGMGSDGIRARSPVRIENVRAVMNLDDGIEVSGEPGGGTVFTPPQLGCVLRGNAAYLNGNAGIRALEAGCVIEGNHATGNVRNGIVAHGAALHSNTATENGDIGIYCASCAATGNVASANGNDGLVFEFGTVARGNSAYHNGENGFRVFESTLSGCIALGNKGFGLYDVGISSYSQCYFRDNNSGGAQVSGGVNLGQNICQNAVCPGAQY